MDNRLDHCERYDDKHHLLLLPTDLDSAKFLEELLLAKAYSYLKVRNFLKRTISAVSQFL